MYLGGMQLHYINRRQNVPWRDAAPIYKRGQNVSWRDAAPLYKRGQNVPWRDAAPLYKRETKCTLAGCSSTI